MKKDRIKEALQEKGLMHKYDCQKSFEKLYQIAHLLQINAKNLIADKKDK